MIIKENDSSAYVRVLGIFERLENILLQLVQLQDLRQDGSLMLYNYDQALEEEED